MENHHNVPDFLLPEIIPYKDILRLALENLEHKKGSYYALIKDYILNYEKVDKKMNLKIKKIIIFIQEYTKITNEKNAIKKLNICLNNLGAKQYKNTYAKLYSICIKYSETTIINNILNIT